MKARTNDLTDVVLDWVVFTLCDDDLAPEDFLLMRHGHRGTYEPRGNYSTNPAEGWPILDRADIDVTKAASGSYQARLDLEEGDVMVEQRFGPTRLVAGLRCFVASHLGDEVDIPEEIVAAAQT